MTQPGLKSSTLRLARLLALQVGWVDVRVEELMAVAVEVEVEVEVEVDGDLERAT